MKRLPPMFRSLIHAVLPLFLIVIVPDRGSGQTCSGDPPCNLTATAVDASEITVTWEGDQGAGHKIQWTTGTTPIWPAEGTNEKELADMVVTYPHTSLTAETQYWYRIKACDPTDFAACAPYPTETTAGNRIATATTGAAGAIPLDVPTGVMISSGSMTGNDKGSITVTWTPVTDVYYTVQWADDEGMTMNTDTKEEITDGTLAQEGLDLATKRWYRVRADSIPGDATMTASGWTTAQEGVAGGQLDPVTGLVASLVGTTATVGWATSPIATSYGIEWASAETGAVDNGHSGSDASEPE